jgi:hypothetical protein
MRFSSQALSGSCFIAILSTLLVTLPLKASSSELGKASVNDGMVTFTSAYPAILQITGPQSYLYSAQLEAGSQLNLAVVGKRGDTLADGIYRWQMTAIAPRRHDRADDLNRGLLEIKTADGGIEAVSGTFTVVGGDLVKDSGKVEETTAKTINHLDNVSIDGSLCVGFDCPLNPTFGFDTILLMENNLRIKFDDTSTIAGFPNNDWELTANDSSNGGISRFSIRDVTGGSDVFTIEADARSSSIYVDDLGRVGFGTSAPYVELHIVDGDTPTLRLAQDGSFGFTPQTWDVSGNETNFFIRDATGGSRLPLRIRPGAPTSSIDIAADGDVGMGTGSPGADGLHITRSAGASARMLQLTNNGGMYIMFENTSSGESWYFNHEHASPHRFIINSSAYAGPEFALTNSGNLTISGALTTAGGSYPDYVFEPGYQLMSLDELAAYIAKNRHLPNVPTSEQTESGQRINMTELQIKLLEKVEELTLYTLRQQERIRALEERLAAIESAQQ